MDNLVLEVPAGFTGTITIKVGLPKSPSESTHGTPEWPSGVQDILARLAKHNPTADHAALASHLVDCGFTPEVPLSKDGEGASKLAYLRWIRDGVKKVTLYQNSSGLTSDSKKHLTFAESLAGGHPEGGVHPRVKFYFDNMSASDVLAVANAFAAYSDGS